MSMIQDSGVPISTNAAASEKEIEGLSFVHDKILVDEHVP